MQCQHAEELFSDYVSGQVDRALAVGLENHIAGCASCREEVAGLRRVWSTLDRLPAVDPPPFFHANLMGRMAAERALVEEAAARKRALWDWRALFRPRALAIAATGLVLMLAGVEVVHTQSAEIGPLAWIASWLHPSPTSVVGLQKSSRAEWLPDVLGGTLIVHLQAAPGPDGHVNRLRYQIRVADHTTIGAQGVTTSEKEVSVTLPVGDVPSGAAPPVTVMLAPADGDDKYNNTIVLPVTMPSPSPNSDPATGSGPHG